MQEKNTNKLGFKEIAVIVVMALILVNTIVFSILTIINKDASEENQIAKDITPKEEKSIFDTKMGVSKEELTRYKIEITNLNTSNYPVVDIQFKLKYMDDKLVEDSPKQNFFISEWDYEYLADEVIYIGQGDYIATYTSLYLEDPENMIVKVKMDDGTFIGSTQTFYTVTAKNFSYYDDYSKFILPFSSIRKITNEDISSMSRDEMALAKAEIYARHGMRFDEAYKNAYFKGKPWYYINRDFTGGYYQFNIIERENIDFLTQFET